MNSQGGTYLRCVRHPSQFFTGFCSSCLAERLSNVGGEIEGISASSSVSGSQRKGNEVRVRTTLLSLFQLEDDDCNESSVGSGPKASTSGRNDAHFDQKIEPLGDGQLRETDSGFRSKGVRWRLKGVSKSGRFGDRELERDGSDKSTWEKPRHSWDGSMMSKALACSFACLEEPQDGSGRAGKRVSEENVGNCSNRCCGNVNVGDAEKPSSSNGSFGNILKESQREELNQDMNVINVSRKKSHRWSRAWHWSITSPFRDFSKKRERALQRSLSGSWHERRKDKSELHSGVHPHGNGCNAPQINQGLSRNLNGGLGEIQKFRPDRKREYRFGQSRSVHYPSPGPMDNGLLRFYLTPMRTSRRSSNNARMQTSHFFAKGILGR